MVVTVVISGIPRNVSISSLAFSLDHLFHTNEISSFRARALPLNVKGKPQAALDFKSGFDAMAAQEILNGYAYEIDDREYVLRAKVTNDPSAMYSDSGASDLDTSLVRHSRGKDRRSRVTDDVDTELNFLSKKLLVVEQERKLIKARKKLKKELKRLKSESETDAEIEPAKKKKKKKKHNKRPKIERSTSRRRSGSRDSSPSPRTPPVEEAMKASRSISSSRIRSRSLSSVSSWSEKSKIKEITCPVVRKSRSKNRSSSPISISSGSEKPSKSKASYSAKKKSRSQETLALVPYRSTSAERTPAGTRNTPQPSTSRARDRDYSRKRTSRNRSPKMSERRRLRSRSLSRSRSPIGRRSPKPRPSSSRYRVSPRRSRWSPARRRSRSTSRPRYRDYGTNKETVYVARAHRILYRSENYDCSITEVDAEHTDDTWAGIDEVLENADKSNAEEKIEEETNVDTASEKINVVINVVKKKTEDKVVAPDAESIKKIMPVPMILDGNTVKQESDDVNKTTKATITNTRELDPELIKKMMPRPIILDAEMIKKEVDEEKSKKKLPRPIVVEIDNIKQEAEVDKEKSKKKVPRPIVVEMDNIKQEASETETENSIKKSPPKRAEPRPNAEKRPASNPQFHLPVVKLLKQIKPCVEELKEELKCNVIKVARDRLITRLKTVLIGQPYMNNTALCAFYRKCFPLESDEEFIKVIVEDIGNGKCDHILLKDSTECDHVLHNNQNNGKQNLTVSREFEQEMRKKLSLGHLVLHLRVTEQSSTSQVETEEAQRTKRVSSKIKKEQSESQKKSRSEKESSSDRRSHEKTRKDISRSKVVAVDEDVAILEKVPELIDLSESEDESGVLQAIIKLENILECTEMPQPETLSPERVKSENIQTIDRTPQNIIYYPEMSVEEIRAQNDCEVLQDVIKSEKVVEHTDLPQKTDKKRKVKKEKDKDKELRKIANTVRRPADDVVNIPVKTETSHETNDLEPNGNQEELEAFNDDLINEIKQELQDLPSILTNDRTEELKKTSTLEEVKTELMERPEESIESIEKFVTLVTNVIDID